MNSDKENICNGVVIVEIHFIQLLSLMISCVLSFRYCHRHYNSSVEGNKDVRIRHKYLIQLGFVSCCVCSVCVYVPGPILFADCLWFRLPVTDTLLVLPERLFQK